MNDHQDYEVHKCHDIGHPTNSEGMFVMWLDDEWQLHIESGNEFAGITIDLEIDYCPFCGEKLDE